jgi:hypothetical protein
MIVFVDAEGNVRTADFLLLATLLAPPESANEVEVIEELKSIDEQAEASL